MYAYITTYAECEECILLYPKFEDISHSYWKLNQNIGDKKILISEISLESYEKSKEELFITVMNDVIKEESEYLDYFFDKSYDNLKGYLEKFILQIKKRYAKEEQNSMQFILRMAYMPPLHLKEEVINNFNIYFLKLENLIKDLFLEDLFLEEKANMATLSFMNMLNGLLVTLIYGGCERFDLKFKASWKVYWAGLNKE